MNRRSRHIQTSDAAREEELFRPNPRRAALFVSFLTEAEAARCYVKFGTDENDPSASERDFDVVLFPNQSLQAAESFPELPKGPVTVNVVNPDEEPVRLVTSEHAFRELPAVYQEREASTHTERVVERAPAEPAPRFAYQNGELCRIR